MKTFLISFSFLIVYLVSAQEKYPFSKWTTKELELARSSEQVNFLDSTEKEILFLCNLVRINPKLFSVTYLQAYLDENELTLKNRYVSSLLETLKSSKSVQVLEADINLYEMAKSHATTMGEKGRVGHSGYDKRVKKFLQNKFQVTGENCSYGYETPVAIVMSLLIDEDVPDCGHRKNILMQNFTSFGVSIQPHKKYGVNCVMNFGMDVTKIKKKTFFQRLFSR